MRRQKRNMNDRAYNRGYQAGLAGKSKDCCPHGSGMAKQQWLTGWREGRVDNWEGYTGVSSIHRVAHL